MKKILLLFTILFLLVFTLSNRYFVQKQFLNETKIYADDEKESDDEKEDEEEDEHKSSSSTSEETEVKTETKQVTTPPTITISVIDPIFKTDSDNDGLVDGIDPHPETDERLFFTDDDSDGIANAFDKHPGDSDFLYLDAEDTNNNGILDFME